MRLSTEIVLKIDLKQMTPAIFSFQKAIRQIISVVSLILLKKK